MSVDFYCDYCNNYWTENAWQLNNFESFAPTLICCYCEKEVCSRCENIHEEECYER